MAEIVFYEKPGCINNTWQKGMLQDLGHEVVARNLLEEPWTADRLRGFFAGQPLEKWFNSSAPRIKSGEVQTRLLNESEALTLMLDDPLLICRPLIETQFGLMSGFESCELLSMLGLVLESEQDLQACPRANGLSSCSEAGVTND